MEKNEESCARHDDSRCYQRKHRNRVRHDWRRARLQSENLFTSKCQLRAKRILLSYGAEIVETDPLLSTDGPSFALAKYSKAREMRTSTLTSTTIPRIGWRIMKLRHRRFGANGTKNHSFCSGLGTSGTFVGTVRKLKEFNSRIMAVSMQPDSPCTELRA